ncbi:MAG TPA: alpha/beta fold hydrolase [Pyrinomonadaceae bacterium]|nr:alpha/beta fold hydrolase [Pyrinomonadaceae bacterium]
MRLRILVTFFLLSIGCASGARAKSAQVTAQGETPPRPFLGRCQMPELKFRAWCGRYEVFEDRASKRGRKIALKVVVLPALAAKPAPDPVFFFAGGPGQGAASLASLIGEGPLTSIRQERDIIFLDQRGTGASNPLTCNLYADGQDLRGYFEDMFPAGEVRACRERLEKAADLKQYTTSVAIEDLDDVRRALGYKRINLYGGSYGTTVALAYLRRYGGHVRSVILAGVAPTSLKLPLPFAKGAQYAIDHLLNDCAADSACRAAFPNLREELVSVLDRLTKGPAVVELTNPFTGKAQSVRLGRGVFAERLRMMLYAPELASRVPLLIHQAYLGDFKPFVMAALPQARGIYQSLSLGMYFSVTCSENVPFITEEDVRRETTGTFLGDYRVRVHQGACREWTRAAVPTDFTNAVESSAPVLLLSGEVDPASPHWLGAEVARHLPNSRQVTIPYGGHGYFSDCISSITTEFISKGSVQGLNTACVEGTRRPPFITTSEKSSPAE